jgi:hypothetical protein
MALLAVGGRDRGYLNKNAFYSAVAVSRVNN